MTVHKYDYDEIHENETNSKPILAHDDIALISDLEVDLDVVVGTAKLDIANLYGLKDGSVLHLDQDVDTLVDVRVNGNIVARGILSVVDDNFAVKITESVNDK